MPERQPQLMTKGPTAATYVASALLGLLLFGLGLTGYAVWTVFETQWTEFPGHDARKTVDLGVEAPCTTDCTVATCQAACEASPLCRGFSFEGGACHYRGGSYADLLWDQTIDAGSLYVFDRQPWATRAVRVGQQAFALIWVKLIRLPSYIVCFQGCDGSIALAGELFGVGLFVYALFYLGDGLLYVLRCPSSSGGSALV